MLIKWTADLSVKNDELDQEHQRWIELLNGFYEGLKEGRSKEALSELIMGMIDYTNYHFNSEENYMESIGYPDLDKHKILHNEYIGKLNEYYDKIVSVTMILSIEVTNYLKNWLVNHIKGTDQKYSSFAEKK